MPRKGVWVGGVPESWRVHLPPPVPYKLRTSPSHTCSFSPLSSYLPLRPRTLTTTTPKPVSRLLGVVADSFGACWVIAFTLALAVPVFSVVVLIAMSSSPSSAATASLQPRYQSASSKDSSLYRRVDYRDGQHVRVVESRRRPHRVEYVEPVAHHRPSSELVGKSEVSQAASCALSSLVDRKSRDRPVLADHVTPYSSLSRTKAFVIQTPRPHRPSKSSTIFQQSDEPITPPSTPRMERLSTPDLDDLDQRPFCDCCVDQNTFKYCVSCGHNLKESI